MALSQITIVGTMTEHQIDELFAVTLASEYDDENPWAAVSKLRMNGNQSIFEKASAWCQSHLIRNTAGPNTDPTIN